MTDPQNKTILPAGESDESGKGGVENDFFKAGHGLPTGSFETLTPAQKKARDRRNMALALGIVGFCLLVFAVTILRLSESVR